MDLKYQFQHGMMTLNHQMDRIVYQILKIILRITLKNKKS